MSASLSAFPSLAPYRARAIAFDGCVGWLHQPRSERAGTAVLICGGIGRDAAQGYRSLRFLADGLAEAGYPTLRYDYPGTGDALDPATPDRWDAWCGSVHRAVDRLREETGARSVVLAGFRLGALLACLAAAERDDVAALMLVEPILRGKSLLTHMATGAKLRPSAELDPPGSLRLDDFYLTAADVTRIGGIDLRHGPTPAVGAVSVFGTTWSVAGACLDAWAKAGIAVSRHETGRLDIMMQPAHQADELADIGPFLESLRAICPPSADAAKVVARIGAGTLAGTGFRERALRFGENGRWAGILCEPEAGGEFVLLVGNTGGDPHHGFARFSVELARRLAAENGIATLRFDFAGLGDSVGRTVDGVEQPTHVLAASRREDFEAALSMLGGLGYRRFAMCGLCSGAYHALLTAAADERIEALVLVNLRIFSISVDRPGPQSRARRLMAALARREVRTLLLYAREDPGLSLVESHFGIEGCELDRASVVVLDGIDHDLSDAPMRRTVGAQISCFLDGGPSVEHAASSSIEGRARHVGPIGGA